MDNKIEIKINGKSLGFIKEKHIKGAFEKYNTNNLEEILAIYAEKIIDENISQLSFDEKLQALTKEASKYGYSSVAEILADYIAPDLRPANEICKNCSHYNGQFCAYSLCRVNPFDKGCGGWKEKQNNEKVTHIATGYVKYGKE